MAERILGIAVDLSASSQYALEWALEHFARDGDRIYVLVVKKKEGGDAHLFEKSGSPTIPMNEYDEKILDKYGIKPDPSFFATIRQFREKKKINVDGKIYYGDAREKITEAVTELKMNLLVVGSRGLGTFAEPCWEA